MIYPWQVKEWQQIANTYKENRLPHALLLTGIKGLGKALFANHLLQALLCQTHAQNNELQACQTCHSCRLVAGRVHPSALWLEPEKEGQAIKIDQVRALSEFVSQSSLQGVYRVVLINEAHKLNMHAANALLKTLEEPAANAILILVAERSLSLPATIVSRCQRILFTPPPQAEALAWLQANLENVPLDMRILLSFVQNAPLAAMQAAQNKILELRHDLYQSLAGMVAGKIDPIKAATKFHQADSLQILELYLLWLLDVLRYAQGIDEKHMVNQDFLSCFAQVAKELSAMKMLKLLDKVQGLRQAFYAGNNLNKQLLLETLFLQWMQLIPEK